MQCQRSSCWLQVCVAGLLALTAPLVVISALLLSQRISPPTRERAPPISVVRASPQHDLRARGPPRKEAAVAVGYQGQR